MRITVAIGLGLALAANGLLMLWDPVDWYALAPGVPETGLLSFFLAGGFRRNSLTKSNRRTPMIGIAIVSAPSL